MPSQFVLIEANEIERVDDMKYVGVFIDSKLSRGLIHTKETLFLMESVFHKNLKESHHKEP